MKKLLFLSLLISISCSDSVKISYQQAPIESVLTCCGSVKNADSHYIVISRAVTAKQTKDVKCTLPANVFYKISEYSSGEISLTLVCKSGKKYVELTDETFSY